MALETHTSKISIFPTPLPEPSTTSSFSAELLMLTFVLMQRRAHVSMQRWSSEDTLLLLLQPWSEKKKAAKTYNS